MKKILILIFIGLWCNQAMKCQTPLVLSAYGSPTLAGVEPSKAVDKNYTTFYQNNGQGGYSFSLSIVFNRSIKAAKVKIKANTAGLFVKVNNVEYTRTLSSDETFLIVDPSSFNSFLIYRNDMVMSNCYEVEVTEVALNTVSMPLTYDAAGNNIYRQIVIGSLKSGTMDSTSTIGIVSDSIGEQHIAIFPNPTNGKLVVKKSSGNETKSNFYQVFDLYGKLILEGDWNADETTIDLEHQSSGTYILILQDRSNKITYKIIKQ